MEDDIPKGPCLAVPGPKMTFAVVAASSVWLAKTIWDVKGRARGSVFFAVSLVDRLGQARDPDLTVSKVDQLRTGMWLGFAVILIDRLGCNRAL